MQALALILSRTFSGRVADQRGRAFVIVPGTIMIALALCSLAWAQDQSHFLISAALAGVGFGMAQHATMALLVDSVPSEQRGLAVSTYFLGFDLGISISSFGLGYVSQVWGFGVMWPISAACTMLGLLGLLVGRRRPGQFFSAAAKD